MRKVLIATTLALMLSFSLVSGYAFIRDDGEVGKNRIQHAPIKPLPPVQSGSGNGGGGGSNKQRPTQAQLQECYNRTFGEIKPNLYNIIVFDSYTEMNDVFSVVYSKDNLICSNKVMSVVRGLFRDFL